jgi:hypothetical protein
MLLAPSKKRHGDGCATCGVRSLADATSASLVVHAVEVLILDILWKP